MRFLDFNVRAKLCVKLLYGGSKNKIRSIKFKKSSNVMINESTMPSKSLLIKIVKEKLFLDYRKFKIDGIKSIKDKIVMLIFIYHKMIPKDQAISSRDDLSTYVF